MHILLAPDKFKGSLTAPQVCEALEAGLKKIYPHATIIKFPLADGGEGTAEILMRHSNGHSIKAAVHDPLSRPVEATYGLSSDHTTAFIELASASGLRLLAPAERDVMRATTAGTGELIKDALERGAVHIVLGIGGTATNDAFAGAAAALGYRFLDAHDRPVTPAGGNLVRIKKIAAGAVDPRLSTTKFTAICDVDNPFFGPHGAALVYAPQKGASPEQVTLLDEGLQNLAQVIQSGLGISVGEVPGAGAGGGVGGGAIAFFNAVLRKGVDVVFELTRFEAQVKAADVIITGEGKLDEQTLHGKLVAGVAALAKKYNKKVIAVAGRNELSSGRLTHLGLAHTIALTDHTSEAEAMRHTAEVMARMAEQHIAKWIPGA